MIDARRNDRTRRAVARRIAGLALAATVATAATGCQPGAAPARVTAPQMAAPTGPAPTTVPGAPGAGPSGAPAETIGVAPPLGQPGAGQSIAGQTVAGALLGRAVAVDPARILAFPAPTGRGALVRGTVSTVIRHGPRDRRRIALTFDSNMTDGMLRRLATGRVRSYANPGVVDELQRLHVPATFFLAGKWVEAYPELTRRIAADPSFELASHSWSHEGFRARCYTLGTIPRADMAADVERSFQVLGAFTAHPSRYFRFPGGCYDAAALAAIAPTGSTVVDFDDVSGDAFGSSAEAIIDRTVAQAQPGSIVVMHITGANAPRTADALPTIVRRLRAAGYQLVTVGDLLA